MFIYVIIQELEREERIEKEKREGGPDPRILEMEILGAQVAPRGTISHTMGLLRYVSLIIHNSLSCRRAFPVVCMYHSHYFQRYLPVPSKYVVFFCS